ncbi:hypothetical protein HS088_TW18G00052 [Tripterygium wilfordii]|uniref:Uncharacterized protein n=1 Tax=Tripterygium wilfordii TaxID=458696 RepID=A0A7J7CBS2_TRIWF|nr:hypothetical protein HS088_TW18G00052 [Tripterygium wilfordii]
MAAAEAGNEHALGSSLPCVRVLCDQVLSHDDLVEDKVGANCVAKPKPFNSWVV